MNFYYQRNCFVGPIVPSVVVGGLFAGISVLQGMPPSPQLAMFNIGGIYLYQTLQCPMVAIHRRESAIHNTLSGAILGYVGVRSFNLAVPFVDHNFFWRYPQITRPMAGAMVYGGIGTVLGVLNNKPF
jgi:hypothetical protein